MRLAYYNLLFESRNITPEKLQVILTKGGYVHQAGQINANQGNGRFSCAGLPAGVWLVQLKSEEGSIYAARKIYLPEPDALQIELTLSSQTLNTGNEVVVDIYSKDAVGNPVSADLALSIAAKNMLESRHALNAPLVSLTDTDMLNQPVQMGGNHLPGLILPEMYGHSINGRVSNRIGNPVDAARVMLSFPGKVAHLRIRRTDNKGRFRFLMDDDIYGVREICLNAFDDDGNALDIALDKDVWEDVPYPSQVSLAFSAEETAALQEMFVHNQLFRAYNPLEPLPVPPLRSTFQDPDKIYVLDEFTRF